MNWEKEREMVLAMSPEELFEFHKKASKRVIRRMIFSVVIVFAQIIPLGFTVHSQHKMEAMRDDIQRSTLDTAKKLDETQLKLTKVQRVCGTARGIKRD